MRASMYITKPRRMEGSDVMNNSFDMVVHAIGMDPNTDNMLISSIFGVDLHHWGFIKRENSYGTVGATISNLLSSGLLSSNRTSNISTYAPTMSPSIAPTWIDPRFRRNFTALLGPNETWSPTFAPTVTLADSEVLTAMTDAISSLSAAQLSSAVAGEAAAVINTANVMMSSGRA